MVTDMTKNLFFLNLDNICLKYVEMHRNHKHLKLWQCFAENTLNLLK